MMSDNENFENLFNTINDFLFIADTKGCIITANKAVKKILGYCDDELIGRNLISFHPKHLQEEAKLVLNQMFLGKVDTCNIPIMTKMGHIIPVETKIYFSVWNDEKVIIGLSRNLLEITLSEKKFYKVFDDNKTMMVISEIESGIILNVNKLFLNKFGFEFDEIIGKSSKNLNIYQDNRQRDEFIKRLKTGKNINDEYIIFNSKYGKSVHCLFSMTSFDVYSGTFVLSSAVDITDFKILELKLNKSFVQQKLLADISQKMLSLEHYKIKLQDTIDLIGNHTGVSRVYIFEDSLDGNSTTNTYEWCNVGIVPQINYLQYLPYDVIPSWKTMLEKDGSIISTNIRNLPKDVYDILSPQKIKSIIVYPIYVSNGYYGFIGFDECVKERVFEEDELELLRTIAGLVSILFERLSLDKKLKESEMRLTLAIENTQAGLWDWDIKSGNVIFNEIWGKMLGYKKDDFVHNVSFWEKIVHPDDMPNVMTDLNHHLEGHSSYYVNCHRLQMKDGKWKWVLDKGKIVEYDENGSPKRAIGTHIDIDSQKMVEDELRNLNSTKDKLFSIIAHDLRGPIGTIMQISDILASKEEMDIESMNEILLSQKELSSSTYYLLDNLLNWARYSRNQIQVIPKNFDLKLVIDEAIINVKYRAKQKGIKLFHTSVDEVFAYADIDMIKAVVRNLLSNAVKFTNRGGEVMVESSMHDDKCKIIFSDSGIGISEEEIAKILSENNYHSTNGTDSEKGTGLGIKLSKNFILINNGDFNLKSKKGVGTFISITIPSATI